MFLRKDQWADLGTWMWRGVCKEEKRLRACLSFVSRPALAGAWSLTIGNAILALVRLVKWRW